jgi:hypothetical protein
VQLIDVIAHLDEYSDEQTIYSRPQPTPQSDAVVLAETEDGSTRPASAGGLHYVLEVFIAKEVIDVWQEWRGRAPTPDEACRAVLHYAKYDAYEPLSPRRATGSLDGAAGSIS